MITGSKDTCFCYMVPLFINIRFYNIAVINVNDWFCRNPFLDLLKIRSSSFSRFRANQAPEVESIIVEKEGLKVAEGAIGLGEITSIPTAPAIAGAYYKYDGQYRTSLPLANTP